MFCFYHLDVVRHINKKGVFTTKYFAHDKVRIEPEDIVLELGAARGITTQIAADQAKKVLAFEPDPRIFPCLERNIRSDNVDLYQYAVWNESTEIDFHVEENVGNSSLIDSADRKQESTYTVRADTIENFVE